MPVNTDLSPQGRRQVLLILGEERGWWRYVAENAPGHRDSRGIEYQTPTYTLQLPDGDGTYELTLLADEVLGWVLAYAWQQDGRQGLDDIAYRPALHRDDKQSK